MNKRIWKLYKELRSLRCEVKAYQHSLDNANLELKQRNSLICFLEEQLRQKRETEVPYNTMSFIVPNLYRLESIISPTFLDCKPRAEYLTKRLTNEMKIKLFDDLIEQGYVRKTRDDNTGEVYEIKVVR